MSIPNKKDLENNHDIRVMVNAFYAKVQKDAFIGPIFNERIQDNWETHLEKMYTFWQSVLFHDGSYHGRPFPPHASLGLKPAHFERWLELFNQNMDDLFEGEVSNLAKQRALTMALVFAAKIKTLEGTNKIPLP